MGRFFLGKLVGPQSHEDRKEHEERFWPTRRRKEGTQIVMIFMIGHDVVEPPRPEGTKGHEERF